MNKYNAREFASFKFYETDEMISWLKRTAKSKNLTINNDTAELLVEQIGNNLRQFVSELEKLKLIALPQSILFYGNDFDAQFVLAKEIARLLNCNKDKQDDCDCLNCKWIREESHLAVMVFSKADNKPDDYKKMV